ncbi:MAG: hypothetical protein IJ161_12385 [Bacteroidales bacterium]|nr:hypothetical protein [Bacteroidales bacterium]
MEDVNNSGLIILLIIAVAFFVLWALFLIKYLCARGSMRAKNRKLFALVKEKDERDSILWDQENELRKNKELIAGLKAELKAATRIVPSQVSSQPSDPSVSGQSSAAPEGQTPTGDNPSSAWDEFSVIDPDLEERIMMHDLEDAIASSQLFLNPSATKDDVASLIKVEKKRLDTLLKNNGEVTVNDLLGKYRLEEAIAKIRELKLDAKKKKEKDATEETEPKKEVTIEDIAKGAGFPSMRAMKKAAKQRYGMNIHELRKVIKI